MSSEKTTTPKPGMSLYANLLDTPEGASISRAPVVFKQATDAPQDDPAMKKQQISAGRAYTLSLQTVCTDMIGSLVSRKPSFGFFLSI